MACEGIDLTKLNKDDLIVDNDTVWLKAQVLEKVYKREQNFYTVIEFSDGCFNAFCGDQAGINQTLLMVADSLLGAGGAIPGLIGASSSSGGGAICGVPTIEAFNDAIKAVDSNAVNQYGFHPAAIMPNACAIPLRSNIKIYGPFVSSNFAVCGGTNAQSDPDLCPWVFGSAGLMNTAGNALANSAPTNFAPKVEMGTITVPELPNVNLGAAPALGGPNLTGINVSFGSSGITTSYTYQTYTPKATGFSRLFIDKIKNISKFRREQIKFLRNNRIDINKINRRLKIIRNINNQGNELNRARADKGTLGRILVGEMYGFHPDVSGQRTVVGLSTLPSLIQEMRYDFDKKAYMSLDGLYGPVSISGDGGLPRYARYSGLEADPQCHRSSPTLPLPPFTIEDVDASVMELDQNNIIIERQSLNPLSNPGTNINASDQDGPNSGHVVDILGRSTNSLEDGTIMNFYIGDKNGQQYEQDYRFLAMRGPLVLHSWGYDTQGKPIPNAADDEASTAAGSFKYEANKDTFLPDWLKKPATWPVAPIDLRFDRDRGVWVSPPSYKIVVAKLEEKLDPYGKAKAFIINKNTQKNQEYGRKIYDGDGQEVKADHDDSDVRIVIVDRIGSSYDKDTIVYAYYDTVKCEYIILSGTPSSPLIRFKLIDICDELAIPPVNEEWGDEWVSYAGYGDKFFDNPSITDAYAVRLNCNGEPVDKDGKVLTSIDKETIKEHLIIVRDVVGKWGPSFSRYTNFDTWMKRAAEGYAAKIPNPSGSGVTSSETECDLRTSCLITYVDASGNTKTVEEEYDIIFLESYARFIHGCLTQDLYTSLEKASEDYPDDYWKITYPSGNALVKIDKFYGNVDNGREPYYLDENEEPVEVRVFDPWISSVGDVSASGCYEPKESHMYTAKSGTPVVAVFNETLKRYEIIEIVQKPPKAVRFRIYDCKQTEASTPDWEDGDVWTEEVGFFDKKPNSHVFGVRIDCDGNPVDRNGKILTQEDISLENPKKDSIFINLFDTAGKFGPSFAGYKNFNHWFENAATGFGLLCEIAPSGNCGLGLEPSCSGVDPDFDSYDIVFLESYARFIHGCLTQDLYTTPEIASTKYSDDIWKTNHPSGNASVDVLKYYGGPDNEKEPKFWNNNIEPLPVRVFDPWVDAAGNPIECYEPKDGPYYSAKSGVPFTAVFNEKKKRYELLQIGKKDETVIRFKVFDFCSSPSSIDYGDEWTQYAGFGDKIPDSHIIGIRIDCDGNPIDINSKIITNEDLFDVNKKLDIFVNLYDTSGKWGPAYSKYNGNFNDWKSKAFTGFAAKIVPSSSGCEGLGSNEQCSGLDDECPSFDIIFLESYARFIHGCLTQDLYPIDTLAYANDEYKVAHPSGNAAIASGCIFYGDSPNGREPKFYTSDGTETDIRVFDPWFEETDGCYDPTKSRFYSATSGTAFTAVFNEKKKKYYLWSIDDKPKNTVRFRLIDTSPESSTCESSAFPFTDTWLQYAGYGDKKYNSHSLAVRIDCDGNPIDKNGQLIDGGMINDALNNMALASLVFINTYDTCGNWGPSFNRYRNYADWVENAATGFGAICEPKPAASGTACGLGTTYQCSNVDTKFDSYDIIFLESYARFIECTLDQDLYPSSYKVYSSYSADPYKLNNPDGNAAATIYNNKFYGNSPNGKRPIFIDGENLTVPIRVFDPFINDDPERNPFRKLKEGDKVLCVFNEKLKKYTIYNSLETDTEVVKFALVGDKNAADETQAAILVNHDNKPITKDQTTVINDQLTFNANIIIVRDPFSLQGNLKSRFGPALGSNILEEHLNGINLLEECYDFIPIFPFVGYALKRKPPNDIYGNPVTNPVYEIITLEHYANYITGKVATIFSDFNFNGNNYYTGVITYHTDGVLPIARKTHELGIPNVVINYQRVNLDGAHSYFVGAIAENAAAYASCPDKIDGCRFIAQLDPSASSSADHLVYTVIEAENMALKGTTLIKDIEKVKEINDGVGDPPGTKESTNEDKIQSLYTQGFMWNKIKSKNRYEEIVIRTKCGWEDQAKITIGSCLETNIVGLKPNGSPVYQVISGTTMAQVAERIVTGSEAGLFGHPSYSDSSRTITDNDAFYEGVSPALIPEAERPKFVLTPDPAIPGVPTHEWMTFQDSRVVAIWNEVLGPDIANDGQYRIVYAQEAPVIITCLAAVDFEPETPNGIIVGPVYSSSQGANSAPIFAPLLNNVENPMGHGAKIGDYVTVQRVWTGGIANGANYKYIVIGTGHPPGPLKT